jgi:hypothetical protein
MNRLEHENETGLGETKLRNCDNLPRFTSQKSYANWRRPFQNTGQHPLESRPLGGAMGGAAAHSALGMFLRLKAGLQRVFQTRSKVCSTTSAGVPSFRRINGRSRSTFRTRHIPPLKSGTPTHVPDALQRMFLTHPPNHPNLYHNP